MTPLSHPSLKAMAVFWVLAAFAAGALATGLWISSQRAWQAHLDRAELTGELLFAATESGAPMPKALQAHPLSATEAAHAEAGQFLLLPEAPRPARITHIPVTGLHPSGTNAPQALVRVLSPSLTYPVARLNSGPDVTAQEMFGQITRLLSTYCGTPLVVMRNSQGQWFRLSGADLWSCHATPPDLRLQAVILGGFALLALLIASARVAQRFRDFGTRLGQRQMQGGPDIYEDEGPAELATIVAAVNQHLTTEKQRLAKRLMVLSGVSHDLGSPATRLRLRAALIEDDALREKLTADIERMSEMIDGVLAYTRSELDVEAPRQLSLGALVEALVDNYHDSGQPVEMQPVADIESTGGQSLFSSRTGHGHLGARQILVTARPMALQRAISNLVDNALKYGRRATLRLEASSREAMIVIEDEGGTAQPELIAALVAPFERGGQEAQVSGHGLGLTIAATVAESHNGHLRFAQGAQGLRVTLTIARSL
ncbi:ATP-binding protein [Thioclava sp. GXIMD4216]|uniref:histidine kinase n=1 Tax=Thioclava litoralis TaxID=3076557 RepID=A0ABZ1DWF4_9RHOB|nr:ATP-binding protein [Thioclava sp. FTW29]